MWCETFHLLLFLLIAGRDDFAHEYAMLSRIAMTSVVSWALWNEALQKHLGSGNPIPERVRTLRWFVAANALAASFQILGAIVQYNLSLANVRTSEIRQSIVLACLLAQIVALTAICTGRPVREMIESIRRPARTGIVIGRELYRWPV
ncbi:hypothetical protein DM02DRAFT_401662 [Periconia macrospinosa]|uniref:Cation-transporting P-type ATPase C-terminal domain-containing protein n=1 Tax=Periconia macrospinosa TaxID=97972 RepID=A0A2V1CYL0_9PLEO|nr:hypothetical protein DM02DRAFT_401662 [Periconia macrospinosa]